MNNLENLTTRESLPTIEQQLDVLISKNEKYGYLLYLTQTEGISEVHVFLKKKHIYLLPSNYKELRETINKKLFGNLYANI